MNVQVNRTYRVTGFRRTVAILYACFESEKRQNTLSCGTTCSFMKGTGSAKMLYLYRKGKNKY